MTDQKPEWQIGFWMNWRNEMWKWHFFSSAVRQIFRKTGRLSGGWQKTDIRSGVIPITMCRWLHCLKISRNRKSCSGIRLFRALSEISVMQSVRPMAVSIMLSAEVWMCRWSCGRWIPRTGREKVPVRSLIMWFPKQRTATLSCCMISLKKVFRGRWWRLTI